MDLVDKIARTEFLGSEFVLWLWFASEVLESEFPLEGRDATGGRTQRLWFDDQLSLALPANPQEKTTLQGVAPTASTEAREALRQGKVPFRAHLGLTVGERTFAFTLNAEDLVLSSVKLPALVNEDSDEQFYERMMLLDQLDDIMDGLLESFVRTRLSRAWASTTLPTMQQWIRDDSSLDLGLAKKRIRRSLSNG